MSLSTRVSILSALVAMIAIALFAFGGGEKYDTVEVERRSIAREVLATGRLESTSATSLYFKSSGKLTQLTVKRGDRVEKGELIAVEDRTASLAEIREASAALAIAEAKLARTLAGATKESVAVSEASLAAAKSALANRYENALPVVLDSFAKSIDAVAGQLAPFYVNAETPDPKLSFAVSDSELAAIVPPRVVEVYAELSAWKDEVATLSVASTPRELDIALSSADRHLLSVQSFIALSVRALTSSVGITGSTLSSYRTAAAAAQSEVSLSLQSVRNVSQAIDSASASLAQADATLLLTKNPTTKEDVDSAQAAVDQARATLALRRSRSEELSLYAPYSGTVTDAVSSIGQTVTPSTLIVSILPDSPLDVRANIAEGSIVGVRPGQRADVSFDAFPKGRRFQGVVSSVDPAESVIGGAVYYRSTVRLLDTDPDLRSGMTANIMIETASSSDALVVPSSAVRVLATSTSVAVIRGGSVVDVPIRTGIKDQNGMIEVLEGLVEGERVVLGTR